MNSSIASRIYLDNAATSWPKPDAVYEAVDRYQRHVGAPAGRSAYREAAEVERLLLDARRQVAQWIGHPHPHQILFTHNGTDSLNLVLSGVLRPGDHVVTTVVEHNSVLRPLFHLERTRQIRVAYINCDANGIVDPDELRRAIEPTTRLIVMSHVSNVTGAIQPAAEVGRIAREQDVLFLLDAAQSLGHVPVQVADLHVDFLAAPGHKGLLGPLGTGVVFLAPGTEQEVEPSRWGGTGTDSDIPGQPQTMPDRYESGNHNVPGILGLGAGVAWLQARGIGNLRNHELELTRRLSDGLRQISGIRVYGPEDPNQHSGVVSISVEGYDPQELASLLDSSYSVQVRGGLHCAPRMHQALGTAKRGGTVRFSVGAFNRLDEVDIAIGAMEEIAASVAS